MSGEWYSSTILCVDDEESVLESYRQILTDSEEDTEIADILAMADERSGTTAEACVDVAPKYKVLLADSGRKAIELVRSEMAAGRRVTAGFFDMRMPGMDGFETIKALREIDEDLICTVVTAYTDRSVTQIRELFCGEHQDQLLYFKKPFAPEELEQSALNMVSAWNNKRHLEEYMRAVEKHKHGLSHILHAVGVLSCVPPQSLQSLLTGLLFQFMAFLEAEHGYVVFWHGADEQHLQFGVGRFDTQDDYHQLLAQGEDFQESLRTNRCHIIDNRCFVPLVNGNQQYGGMYIEAQNSVENRADRGLLEIFKTQMIQLILNSLYHLRAKASEEEAVTDPLTGLYNRRFLMKIFLDELHRDLSATMQLAVIMVDLDDFKRVNDIYGHEAGDVALRKVGHVMQLAVRNCDLLGLGRDLENIGKTEQFALRMGGEEFCVILLKTGLEGAKLVAERIRALIAKDGFVYEGEEIPIFASVGVWAGEVCPQAYDHEDMLGDLFCHADQALYQAKALGKNQVVVFEGQTTEG